MTLQIRHLNLRIVTSNGLFGVEIPFETGLFVLHADNTSGKSTCLQSILYALALEGMMGPSQQIPLPPVATDFLEYEGITYEVLESEVLLEISNGTDILTVRRQIKGNQNRHLVNVWEGAMLSQTSNSYMSRDYIVREPGGASREVGFHRLLAEFIGWQLPNVPTYDENETLLYMETLFPFMFVEQKHGWTNLRNRLPTYFRIKDLNRRAFEYLLDLDAQEIATQKVILKQQESTIKNNWSAKINECSRLTEAINAIVNNIPPQPISTWPPSVQPKIMVSQENDWIDLSQVIAELESRLQTLENMEIPNVEQVTESAQQELQEKQEELLDVETKIKLKFEKLESQVSQISEIQDRISSLQEELSKNSDLRRLSNLGSAQSLQSNSGTCPTCNQNISDSLISPQDISEPMTIDQNVEFIREQLKIFESMYNSEVRNLELQRRQLNGIKSYATEIREDIRSLKTTLTSPNDSLSYSAIEERIRLTERIRHMKLIRDQVDVLLGGFSVLSEEWHEVQMSLATLPKGILSEEDNSKLTDLEQLFQQQLQEYGFSSLNSFDIKISPNSYFPEYEGFDLQFDLSASDYIRIFWAYLLGLLEVSRTHQTNHLGLLVLDEPRQQSAREASIKAFLSRASRSQEYNQQVIIATSESRAVLQQYLGDIPHTYRRFDGRIISPIS
jgi:hypothetical protein